MKRVSANYVRHGEDDHRYTEEKYFSFVNFNQFMEMYSIVIQNHCYVTEELLMWGTSRLVYTSTLLLLHNWLHPFKLASCLQTSYSRRQSSVKSNICFYCSRIAFKMTIKIMFKKTMLIAFKVLNDEYKTKCPQITAMRCCVWGCAGLCNNPVIFSQYFSALLCYQVWSRSSGKTQIVFS